MRALGGGPQDPDPGQTDCKAPTVSGLKVSECKNFQNQHKIKEEGRNI